MCLRPCFVRLFWYLNVLLQSLYRKVFSSVWGILWLCSSLGEPKLWAHWSHLYGFSPVCTFLVCGQLWKVTLWTFVRLCSIVDHFVTPHIWQLIWRISTLTALMRLYPCVSHNVGFQSTSLSGWVFALCTFVRLLPRMSDQVSFQISSKTKWFATLSPEWVTKCSLKCPARPNDLLHCAHLCNFSPVWIIMWILRWLAETNDLLHCAHLYDFSPVWIFMWVLR